MNAVIKRGMLFAGLAALLWLSWAAGFTPVRAQTVSIPFPIPHSSPTSIDRRCSEQPKTWIVARGAESLN